MTDNFSLANMKIGTCVPHVVVDQHINRLTYLEYDRSIKEVPVPHSNIILLKDNVTGEIVGVVIEGFSELLYHKD